jgi:hypothetical protein
LAVEYGKVYGDLPKDSSGTSRIWSPEAVRRLEAARALMAAGQARSIRDALLAVEGGAAPRVEVAVSSGDVAAALGVVATRLEALQDANARLEAEVAALRSEVAGLKALPGAERPAVVGERQRGGESPGDDGGAAEGSPDGPMVRAARWLERRLRGGRR